MIQLLNSDPFSVYQPSSLALEGANPATGLVLKEHLYAYSYPQTGYQAVPQGHTYTPSALQQEFPNGNVFHESHMVMKYDPQCYSSASMSSSLPWSSSYTSGYRSLENSSGSPGSFLHDLLADSAGSKVVYDEFLRSRYSNGGANFSLLQQVLTISIFLIILHVPYCLRARRLSVSFSFYHLHITRTMALLHGIIDMVQEPRQLFRIMLITV